MKDLLAVFFLATVLCACAQPLARVAPPEPVTAKPADLHTSRDSLDWAGVYEGVLPGADPAGIVTRLTLNREGTYERLTRYPGRQDAAQTVRGRFTWHPNGNAIRLDEVGGGQPFAVGEGRLLLLHPGGGPAGTPVPDAVLTLVRRPERTWRRRSNATAGASSPPPTGGVGSWRPCPPARVIPSYSNFPGPDSPSRVPATG